jgi:hypothetical protein
MSRDRQPARPGQRAGVVVPILLVLAGVLGALTLTAITNKTASTDQRVQTNEVNAHVAKKRADTAASTAVTAKKRADKNAQGLRTVVREVHTQTRIFVRQGILERGPKGIEGGAGPIGRTGPPGKVPFTLTELAAELSPRLTEVLADRLPAALELACGGSCNGKDGADGKDAPVVTQEQLDLAVAHYCDARNGCVGPASTVPGPQGVQGEASTVPGPAGADGQPGPQGPPGTLVLSVPTACPDGNGGFVTGVATDPDGDGNFTCP